MWGGYMWPTLNFSQAVRDTIELAGGGIFVQQLQCKMWAPFFHVCVLVCVSKSKQASL